MMCTKELYRYQIEELSADRAVQFVPISGHSDMSSLASDVLEQAPAEFALCGLSMGGIVAMEVQRQAPQRVKGLALLDTNPLAELDVVKQKRIPQMASVDGGALLQVMRQQMMPNYFADSTNATELVELCASMAEQLGPDVFIRQSIALRDRPDQTASIQAVRVPSLVLCGEQDKLCPVERHRLIQSLIPEATLAIIPEAGHLPVLEQPTVCNQYLHAWLSACDEQIASQI